MNEKISDRRSWLKTAPLGAGGLWLTGCTSMRTGMNRPIDEDKPGPRNTSDKVPTASDLVIFLDRQAKKIQLLDSQDLSVETTAQGRRAPGLADFLVCEKPRNFRLTAKVAGMQQVDFGSNADQFWFWVKQAPEPHLFYCRYDDFDKGGIQLPFPFQPEWVLEALGMGEYTNPDKFRMEVSERFYELTEDAIIQGQPYKKITLINRFSAAPPVPQVASRVLKDNRGRTICTATIRSVQRDRRSDVIVPRKVDLEWPIEQIKMTLTLDDVKVNASLRGDERTSLFSRPNWRDVKNVDLAQTARPTGNTRASR